MGAAEKKRKSQTQSVKKVVFWFYINICGCVFVCVRVHMKERERGERRREAKEGGTMNSSSSGSAPKHVETTSLLQRSFSRRISSNKNAISGGAPTCVLSQQILIITTIVTVFVTCKNNFPFQQFAEPKPENLSYI